MIYIKSVKNWTNFPWLVAWFDNYNWKIVIASKEYFSIIIWEKEYLKSVEDWKDFPWLEDWFDKNSYKKEQLDNRWFDICCYQIETQYLTVTNNWKKIKIDKNNALLSDFFWKKVHYSGLDVIANAKHRLMGLLVKRSIYLGHFYLYK